MSSGSLHIISQKGPSWGISWTRSIVRIYRGTGGGKGRGVGLGGGGDEGSSPITTSAPVPKGIIEDIDGEELRRISDHKGGGEGGMEGGREGGVPGLQSGSRGRAPHVRTGPVRRLERPG